MTPHIKNCVERARHYQDEILQEISKHQTADNTDRSLLSTAYIKMANGDYSAILSLVAAENPGAAFKLFRLLYGSMRMSSLPCGCRRLPVTTLLASCCTAQMDNYPARWRSGRKRSTQSSCHRLPCSQKRACSSIYRAHSGKPLAVTPTEGR